MTGARALSRALIDARGTMSQGEAATLWDVPLSTLQAIEQGVDRHYQSQTLARLDAVLGRSAYDIFYEVNQSADVAAQIDDLRQRVKRIEERPGWADEMFTACVVLSPDDRAMVFALAYRLGGRR